MTFAEKTKELKLIINKLPLKNQVELLTEYKHFYALSERNISARLDISKSQVHRLLSLNVLPKIIWDYLGSGYGIWVDKYVLYDLAMMPEKLINKLAPKIVTGEVRKRAQLKELKERLLKARR